MASSVTPAHVWPLGDHRLGAWPETSWIEAAQSPERWTVAFQAPGDAEVFGEAPRVVGVTIEESGVAALDLDARMRPGVGYALNGVGVAASSYDIDEDVAGPYPRLLHTAPTVPPLLDIDAPTVPAEGVRMTAAGDYAMSAELATVEKMLWAVVLTAPDELDWEPRFGSALELRRLRPADLSAARRHVVEQARAVPHVRAVEAQILFEGDEVFIAIDADTDFGRLESRHAAR